MAQFTPSATQQTDNLIEVRPSPIHGYGVFARTHIPEGAFIGCYEGPIVYDDEDDGDYVLWVLEEDDTGYGIDGQNALRYVNHHSEANAIFYEEELHALCNIEPGEEICHHYGEDWD